jgi:ubiquinone/menaquinone biosynthesis C-methylase UbiE
MSYAVNEYVLGHANHELKRLVSQSTFFGPLTEQVLRSAGLAPGMHVLDVGCGAGDVAFLAASMVGPRGSVVGIDRSMEAIALATKRASAAKLANVRFEVRDVHDTSFKRLFDAVIGRFVLMYFPDPAAVLSRVRQLAVPGGVIAFHEFDLEACSSEPQVPLYTQCISRLLATFKHAQAETRMGLKLVQAFRAAGLPEPQTIVHTRLGTGSEGTVFEQIAAITRTLLPAMEKFGVATAAEVDVDTLAARLQQAVRDRDATVIPPLLIGAWAHNVAY